VRCRFKQTADQRRDKATRGRSRMERVKRFLSDSTRNLIRGAHASRVMVFASCENELVLFAAKFLSPHPPGAH
jgi:hypothetical protein